VSGVSGPGIYGVAARAWYQVRRPLQFPLRAAGDRLACHHFRLAARLASSEQAEQ